MYYILYHLFGNYLVLFIFSKKVLRRLVCSGYLGSKYLLQPKFLHRTCSGGLGTTSEPHGSGAKDFSAPTHHSRGPWTSSHSATDVASN